ncbi:MAG: hypothetical protein ACRDU8_06250, partial [Egibacteraceae bacterium]
IWLKAPGHQCALLRPARCRPGRWPGGPLPPSWWPTHNAELLEFADRVLATRDGHLADHVSLPRQR